MVRGLDFFWDTDPTVTPKVVRECENHSQNSFHVIIQINSIRHHKPLEGL